MNEGPQEAQTVEDTQQESRFTKFISNTFPLHVLEDEDIFSYWDTLPTRSKIINLLALLGLTGGCLTATYLAVGYDEILDIIDPPKPVIEGNPEAVPYITEFLPASPSANRARIITYPVLVTIDENGQEVTVQCVVTAGVSPSGTSVAVNMECFDRQEPQLSNSGQ